MSVDKLNTENEDEVREVFLGFCGSLAWVDLMLQARPYDSAEHMHRVADQCFEDLNESDWLEAFAAHPKLGDLESLRMKFAGNKQWSAGEQAGVQAADADTLEALAEGNARYEQAFGYIFILCATGVSADQMLARLRDRLNNPPEEELRIAANQQRQITHLRIDKWLNEPPSGTKGIARC